jgi:hypothetical protein
MEATLEEVRVLCPTAGLGYGFPEESLEDGLERNPHVIGVDAGSTDPGPYYLGAGVSILSRDAQKRDLEFLLLAQQRKKIPLIIGTAGGAGAKPNLEWTIDIMREIAKEKGIGFTLARIEADIDKDFLKKALLSKKIKTFELQRELTVEEIDRSENIVAQMGVEPFIEALRLNPDVIVAGRAYDPAIFAALPIMNGCDKGLAIHMGKIIECGCMAAEPSTASDVIIGVLRKEHFVVEPINKERRCTKESVAAHTLYEKDNPVRLLLPGGVLDLTKTRFEEITERSVKVARSRFVKDDVYTLKLEGASRVGYRTIFIAGIRDPIMIHEIENVIQFARESVETRLKHIPINDYQILFHVYGRNGVMGDWEYARDVPCHELGIVGEVIGRTQEIASTVCSFARGIMLHCHYSGRKATAGNLAFLYSPSDIKMGEVFEFNIYHLLKVDNPIDLFPISIEKV